MRNTCRIRRTIISTTIGMLTAALAITSHSVATADPIADFYRGKTITLVLNAGAGGMFGLYGRTFVPHMARHVPGKPTMVVQYMPGAARMANYVYNAAPKDGTYIAAASKYMPMFQVLRPTGVKYEATKFNWIGNIARTTTVVSVWHKAPATSLADAKRKQVIIAATGLGSESAINPLIMNALLGTKFKVVTGYKGIAGVHLALANGEGQGMSFSYISLKTKKPQWLRDKKVIHLAQVGMRRNPELPDVPLLIELVSDPKEKAIMEFVSAANAFGRNIFAPPGVPAARVAALRKAFDATMKDPQFLADAKKRGLRVAPVSGVEVDRLVRKVVSTPPALVKRTKEVLGY